MTVRARAVARAVRGSALVASIVASSFSTAKAQDAKPTPVQPSETKPTPAQPSEAKPIPAQPSEAKPIPAQPSEAKPEMAPPALSRQECLKQHESAQEDRNGGKLLESRDALRACSSESCPELVREDCVGWLGEVERAIPSVVFEVVIGNQDLPRARITEGDRVWTETLDGAALEMDVGVHKLKAEIPDHLPMEMTLVTREGEKARVVRFDFTPPPVAPLGGAEAPVGPRPVPIAVYATGAGALVAIGLGTAFGVEALQQRNDLTCSPFCTSSDLSSARSFALASDIAFGGAAVLAGVSAYLWITRPVVPGQEKTAAAGEQVSRIRLRAVPIAGPGLAGLSLTGSL